MSVTLKEVEVAGESDCTHDFEVMEIDKNKTYPRFGVPKWEKVTRFYCTKCLHIKRITRYDHENDQPDWY